ncbi:MAG: SAM-dependent chlorinase/fluorinase [Betaproteobacteria bacterium]|nr:SAM-dependent chlorinase/fluorinase [Betaproteobacteria bacterium]
MAIVLFTDFGSHDLYVGQVMAVLAGAAPGVPVIDLLHDAPAFDVESGAHLLAALAPQFPEGSVFLAVVDPGVGTGRAAVVVEADGRHYVGPDNGLLSVIAGRSRACRTWNIAWRPESLAPSFHGRDLFAPVAATLAAGGFPADRLIPADGLRTRLGTGDLPRVIYVDHYGNAMTGIRAAALARDATMKVNGTPLPFARVFGEAPPGRAFWHENSVGLVEISVNRGSAAQALGLAVGQRVELA